MAPAFKGLECSPVGLPAKIEKAEVQGIVFLLRGPLEGIRKVMFCLGRLAHRVLDFAQQIETGRLVSLRSTWGGFEGGECFRQPLPSEFRQSQVVVSVKQARILADTPGEGSGCLRIKLPLGEFNAKFQEEVRVNTRTIENLSQNFPSSFSLSPF